MKALKFIIGLITFSLIATVVFFALFKKYNSKFIFIDTSSSLKVEVLKSHYMNGSMYVNNQYSLPLLFDDDRNCLCDNLREGDLLYKIKDEKEFYRVRNLDTLMFVPDL